MTKEKVLQKIRKEVNKTYPNETVKVRDYIVDLVYLTYQALDSDSSSSYTSKDNLDLALVINLEDDYANVLNEARKEFSY